MTRSPLRPLEPLEDRLTPAAQLQLIHDSAFAATRTIDVYINGNRFVNDMAFRTATAFTTLPSNVPLKIDINPGTAPDNANPASTLTITLLEGSSNLAIVAGDPTATTGDTRLGISIFNQAQESADQPGNADFLIYQGSTDAGTIDVKLRNTNPIVNDLPYGRFAADYLSLPTGKYTFDVTGADGITPAGSFAADLTFAAGRALVVLASGFVSPPNATDPRFGLLVAFEDGTTTLLPAVAVFGGSTFAVGGAGSAKQFAFDGTAGAGGEPFSSNIVVRTASADVTGDGIPDLITTAGPGGPAIVRVFDGVTQQEVRTIDSFESTFTGGAFVSAGDIDRDGFADIIVSADTGGGPRVRVFSGRDGSVRADFLGIADPNFRGGARTAVADVNGDGTLDLLVAAGAGGGPRVAGFDGRTVRIGGTPARVFADFFVFEETLRDGVFLTGGDLNGDGFAEVIVGGGPGGGPRVLAINGRTLVSVNLQLPVANFFAGTQTSREGVRLAAKDLDGDYIIDLVVGLGADGTPQVALYKGTTLTAANPDPFLTLNPFGTAPAGGVFVG